MPAANEDLSSPPKYESLPFAALTRRHVLHSSVHFWYPRYRSLTPKARIITLSDAFIAYLRADRIVLPPDASGKEDDVEFEADLSNLPGQQEDHDDAESEDSDTECDPSTAWPEVHMSIVNAINELGGRVAPKLNWSAPKDATWINATNSMDCHTANDIYLMLKSSDFVTHDLEHWDDDCTDDHGEPDVSLQNVLMLRKFVMINPSVEFRCFVRNRQILGICQRDMNYFDFLFPMIPHLRKLIKTFFEEEVRSTFPESDYTFDVYIPSPHQRVWLIDFNPWAPRTDPILFSWLELLTMEGPEKIGFVESSAEESEDEPAGGEESRLISEIDSRGTGDAAPVLEGLNIDDVEEEELFQPDFRLVKKDDPEAYSFNTPQYSAHKLPRDIVEASQSGLGPLREFANQWKEVLDRRQP